jgi:hypothetical protein
VCVTRLLFLFLHGVLNSLTAIIFLLLICCGIQRRRIRQAARPYAAGGGGSGGPGPRPPLLPLSSSARFPHGMQYGHYNGGTGTSPYAPPPGPAPPGSEYPPAAAADWAPPPYVKEADGEAVKYPPVRVSSLLLLPMDVYSLINVRQPPGPPPPGFDATYAPVRLPTLSPTQSQLTHLCVQPPAPRPPRTSLYVILPSRSFLPVSFSSLAISSPTPPTSAAASAPARVITTPRVGACLPIHDLAGYATSYVISILFHFISLGLMPHARMHAFCCICISTCSAPRATLVLFSFFFGLLCRCRTRTRILLSALGPGTQPLDWKRLPESATAVQRPPYGSLARHSSCVSPHTAQGAMWGEQRPFDAGMSHAYFELGIFWPLFLRAFFVSVRS